jgi:hypothetical protein
MWLTLSSVVAGAHRFVHAAADPDTSCQQFTQAQARNETQMRSSRKAAGAAATPGGHNACNTTERTNCKRRSNAESQQCMRGSGPRREARMMRRTSAGEICASRHRPDDAPCVAVAGSLVASAQAACCTVSMLEAQRRRWTRSHSSAEAIAAHKGCRGARIWKVPEEGSNCGSWMENVA